MAPLFTEQLNYIVELVWEVPSLRVRNSTGDNLLTPREEQVVALVAEGLGNRQIARELNLSEHSTQGSPQRPHDASLLNMTQKP
jgi:DNA-binding NarL/FixJ family response regulator